jgi:asparagine synthetase B (glutamine-hydrolysing)
MCGISFAITDATADEARADAVWSSLVAENARRGGIPPATIQSIPKADSVSRLSLGSPGPTSQGTHSLKVDLENGVSLRLHLASAVLALRGKHTPQPLVGQRGLLCWNGQVSRAVKFRLRRV